MASPSKKTSVIRKHKRTKAGRKRKALLRNRGTTPSAEKLFGETELNEVGETELNEGP